MQVVYCIAAKLHGSTAQLLQTYVPSESEIVTEWRTTLSFLPGVAPKDGGQKEVLPGDEIVLLTSQYLEEASMPERHRHVFRARRRIVARACLCNI